MGVLLSVLLHASVGYVAATLPMDLDRAAAQPRVAFGASTFTLDPADFAAPPPPPPAEKPLTAMLVPPEPPPPPPPPLTPEEIERKLVLGIDESTQITHNWMGFSDPTEHKAPLSTVEQPQLDPNPGAPGAPSTAGVSQSGPRAPLLPETSPSDSPTKPVEAPEPPPAHEGVPTPDPSKPVANKPLPGGAEGSSHVDPAPPREGEEKATGVHLSQPKRGTPEITHVNPDLPGPRPDEPGHTSDAPGSHPEDLKAETPRKVEPTRGASAPKLVPPSPPVSPVNVPDATTGAAPAAPMPTGGSTVSSAPGRAGEHAGDASPNEADASSTTPTFEIRPGRPAAAQGLNLTTKRPNFTRLVRVTAFPQNPLLKVTFSRLGVVTHVKLVESSGVADVDGPVINALYQWTAQGKVLAELNPDDPEAGITVSIRILLR